MGHTMREVAKRAGVSPATVSRVLNKTRYISTETEQRVLEVVRQLNYYKNVHARRLATGQSDLFGLVISEIANPYFPEIIRGFQASAWDRGLDVLLCNTEYDQSRTKSVIRKLIESDVRGAAVIAGPEDNHTAIIIKQALVNGLKARKLSPFPVLESNYRVDAGASSVRAILSQPEIPTVVFCGSDLIAMGAMSALEAAGVKIPEDVSVIGIDDISFAFLARPPLTTIRVPRERLGTIAFEALDKMLKLKRRRGADYYVETELVVRRSTAAAREQPLRITSLDAAGQDPSIDLRSKR